MKLRRWSWLLLSPLAACQPNTTGMGTGSANSVGEESGGPVVDGTTSLSGSGPVGTTMGGGGTSDGPGTLDGGPPPTTTVDPTATTTVDPTATTDDPTTDGGTPLLEVSDGPTFDFGNVPVGGTDVHAFTVTNTGDGEATGVAGLGLAAPFDYEGGAYPGTAGTCGDTLAASDSCTVTAAFGPTVLGPYAETLAIQYDGGVDASRPMTGGGSGQSSNLLVNPGGEAGGDPPMGWTDNGAGTWVTAAWVTPQAGSWLISAYTGPDNSNFLLIQDVDVDTWADAIDLGVMRFDFTGYARAWVVDNDEYRIRVRYRDGGGSFLDTWTSGWDTAGAWELRGNTRLAPTGTRSIRVELACRKGSGTYCDAYYDALDLHALYP